MGTLGAPRNTAHTLSPGSIENSYQVDEVKWKETLENQRLNEIGVLEKNPFLSFDSTLVWELTGSNSNANYELSMKNELLDELLGKTGTTYMNVEGSTADLRFDRNALQSVLEKVNGNDFTIIARRLTDEEAQILDSDDPTYQFVILPKGGEPVSDFQDGSVQVSVPYVLNSRASDEDVYVEHIKDDGTVEILDAVYDSQAGTVTFVTDGFSYFRIVGSGETPDDGSDTDTDTGSGGSSDGGSGDSGINSSTVTNDDGSKTATIENTITGTVTQTTTYPDGSKVVVETKADGTVTTKETDAQGNQTVTVVHPDGSSTTTETWADGTTVEVTAAKDGTVTAVVTLASQGETKVLIPADLGSLPGRVSVEATYPDGESETVMGTYENGCVAVVVKGSAQLRVLDDFTPREIPFADVDADAYYAGAVLWALANGITAGTSESTFSPDASCTRAQMVTYLWRAAGSPEPVSAANPFTDVSAEDYYYKAVLWAVENGITSGTSATTFGSHDAVTRGQTVTFLYRAAGSPAASGADFSDVAEDAYYAPAVAWALARGITAGTSATTFSPDALCTRGQIVTFLYRDRG